MDDTANWRSQYYNPALVRTKPPWREGVPALRVGFDPDTGDYIIRAPGGHIIGASKSLEEVGRLIQYESDNGYGSVELLLQHRHYATTYRPQTWHGVRQSSGRAKPSGKLDISLSDLDLDL